MRVCLGGTFEPFHAGHKALLRAAAEGATELFVGVTDGSLAQRASRSVSPWPERARRVESFLCGEAGYRGGLTVRALTDPLGPAATGPFDAIAASPETIRGAEAVNSARRRAGLPELAVRLVPHVLGEDLLPVSGTAVHAGAIDAEGRRLRPVQVAVGSRNGVKLEAVREECSRLWKPATELRGFEVGSGVPEQPRDDETLRGARLRARAALDAWPGADYGIGVEAGLVRLPGDLGYLELQACAVVDRNGRETHGWGPGFHYPDWVTERALAGEMVSDILGPVAQDPRIGSTTGAIGYLSEGRLDRTALTRTAVLMAFLPRLRPGLYQATPQAPSG